jgi:phosphoribosylformimino-5-aminoimidazole carboxamide ribotide isomerase
MGEFILYPAIDLREGKVVRLRQGDPGQLTQYDEDPAAVARRWFEAGTRWLHVVNLDGAFGENSQANFQALEGILAAASQYHGFVQFGGGLRTLEDIERVIQSGVERVILGTAAVESPDLVMSSLEHFGTDHLGAALDAKDGMVYLRGWKTNSEISARIVGRDLYQLGLRTAIFTNISRDGMGSGADIKASKSLAEETRLDIIASGGVNSLEDIRQARQADLAGIIVGRALYEGKIDLRKALKC